MLRSAINLQATKCPSVCSCRVALLRAQFAPSLFRKPLVHKQRTARPSTSGEVCRVHAMTTLSTEDAPKASASGMKQGGILAGKWVIITGASRGIGQAIAEQMADEKANLILLAQREDALKEVAEICKKKGSQQVDVRPIDLSDMAAVDKFAEDVLQKYGCIDVLVNNAAILGPISYDGDATKNPNMGQGPIDGNPDEWEKVIRVNMLSPMRLMRRLTPAMVEKGEGVVINIDSSAGLAPKPGNAVYSSSKWGFRGWSKGCTMFFKDKGIKVVTVYPPATYTPMTTDREDMEPVPEKEAQPSDIAKAAMLVFSFSANAMPDDISVMTMAGERTRSGPPDDVKQ
ncbi:hypothetical protein ABBQ32_004811 [Trebouxia sp. C0010 RCD-2024]